MDENGEHIFYEPNMLDRGEMIGAFAYAKMRTGELQFEVMNIEDIEKVRTASRNSDSGPWVNWYESMSRKSVMHRLGRRLPNNPRSWKCSSAGKRWFGIKKRRHAGYPRKHRATDKGGR